MVTDVMKVSNSPLFFNWRILQRQRWPKLSLTRSIITLLENLIISIKPNVALFKDGFSRKTTACSEICYLGSNREYYKLLNTQVLLSCWKYFITVPCSLIFLCALSSNAYSSPCESYYFLYFYKNFIQMHIHQPLELLYFFYFF